MRIDDIDVGSLRAVKNIKRSEEGVSEVVGTILTLGITVVLFTGVFAAVTNLPEPQETTHVDFKAEIDGQLLNITHIGGSPLPSSSTSIFLLVGGSSYNFRLDDEKVTLEGEEQDRWQIDKKLTIDISHIEITTREVEILVIDQNNKRVLWDSYVMVAPLSEILQIKDAGVIYRYEWEDHASAGEEATLYVDVISDQEVKVLVNLRRIDGYADTGAWNTSYHNMTHTRANRFVKRLSIDATQDNGTYQFNIEAHNRTQDSQVTKDFVIEGIRYGGAAWASERSTINIGLPRDLRGRPDIKIDPSNVRFTPISPTSGDPVTVHALVKNDGGSPAEVTVEFINEDPSGKEWFFGSVTVNVPAGGERDISATSEIFSSGEHIITIEATDIVSDGGEDMPPASKRRATSSLFVQPRILIVMDDHEFEKDSDLMIGALEGADYDFDVHRVMSGDGPPLSKLNRYDIVIWLTGRTKGMEGIGRQPTLTENDRQNIEGYLSNGNNFWLLGEGIYEDSLDWDVSFLRDNFGVSGFDADSSAPSKKLYGHGILHQTNYAIREDIVREGNHINTLGECMLEDGLGSGNCIATTFTNERDGNEFRTAFNSFTFDSLKRGHTLMAVNVIQWLGNVTHRSARDIAVTHQEFSTRAPLYRTEVEITASIRNNGPINETVQVRLFINDDMDRTQRKSLTLLSGQEQDVTFDWVAKPVGRHELRVVADPYHQIPERNTRNNDITYKNVDITINVQFSVLLVDHDASSTQRTVESLDRLGYEYEIVSESQEITEDYLSRFNAIYWMAGDSKHSIDDVETLTMLMNYLDHNPGVSFFLQGTNVLTNITQALTPPQYGSFFRDYMGIELDLKTATLAQKLQGIHGDPVSHGIGLELKDEPVMVDAVEPYGAQVVFLSGDDVIAVRHQTDTFKTFFMSPGLEYVVGPDLEHRSYHDFDGEVDVSHKGANQQLIFTLTKWFGNVDERTELRVADQDITIPEDPMLGRSYQVKAIIENIGFKDSNALVRFKDGDFLIASESIYVPSNGVSDAEVNWRPIFAGHGESERKIRVLVDPIYMVDEIGVDHMAFNNLGVRTTPVYYFYDDLERGSEKWTHETVLANIDGESPIDYMGEDYERVYSDIVSDWDLELSEHVEMIDHFSYSHPNSFMLAEPRDVDIRLPLDMGLMIDTTGSMEAEAPDGRTWMEHAIEATQNMLDLFNERDRVAIFELDSNSKDTGTFLYEDFRYMTEENREYFKERVGEFTAHGGTPLWDASGYTIEHVINYPRPEGVPGVDYIRSVMLFTDGVDEHFVLGSLEAGSDEYAPGSLPGYGPEDQTWGVMEGHLWGDGPYDYRGQGPGGDPWNHDVKRYYVTTGPDRSYPYQTEGEVQWQELSYRDRQNFWGNWVRGTRSTQRKSLMQNPTLTFTVALGVFPSAYLEADHHGYMPKDAEEYPFTSEYQLTQIAESTGGSYFYAPDADELDAIFEEVFKQAAKEAAPGNLTSIPVLMDADTFPIYGKNQDKSAVTHPFNLEDYSSARLSFFHKYKMVRGMNGAYLQIGYIEEGQTEYSWKYISPSRGSYTGNLNLSHHREDDFGNEIRWAWNGVSGGGSFGWDPVSVDLLRYIPEESRDDVRIRFQYVQYGMGTGYGWFLDDVQIRASRETDSEVKEGTADVWQMVETTDIYGQETTAWWNGILHDTDPRMKTGIDNSLVTSPIDLTRAKTVHLSADFKFNINEASGSPPDGFRVEVSTDNGLIWSPINLGARTASGVSGDGSTNYWTTADQMDRLITDLSDFAGETILIRFRVVTNNAANYQHHHREDLDFRGIYLNNVVVQGETVER